VSDKLGDIIRVSILNGMRSIKKNRRLGQDAKEDHSGAKQKHQAKCLSQVHRKECENCTCTFLIPERHKS